MRPARIMAASLVVCGLAHAVIDALCAGILFTLYERAAEVSLEAGITFGLYNLLAFGTQPFLGLAVDRSRKPRMAALLGGGLVVAGALVFNSWPLTAVIAAGLGNAVFHLGAGSICLQLTPGRAAAPGIFVAPGALGLFLGTYLGQAGAFQPWPFVIVLAGLGVALMKMPLPVMAKPQWPPLKQWKWGLIVLALLLSCVGARSLVGLGVEMPWKSVFSLAITMTLAVALGKALGGVLADRLGWGRIAVGGLALSTPLLAYGAHSPAAAIPGLFLFNLTMAVTLAAVTNVLPGRPAFAFGLTCLALEVGAWPVIQQGGVGIDLSEPWVVFGVTLAAAAALYVGLRAAFRQLPASFTGVYASIPPA